MTYLEFVRGKLGSNWVVARRTSRILARYGEDVVCVSQQRLRAIDKEYRALYGDPYDDVRARMYRALVTTAKFLEHELANNAVDPDNGRAVLHSLKIAIAAEQERP